MQSWAPPCMQRSVPERLQHSPLNVLACSGHAAQGHQGLLLVSTSLHHNLQRLKHRGRQGCAASLASSRRLRCCLRRLL